MKKKKEEVVGSSKRSLEDKIEYKPEDCKRTKSEDDLCDQFIVNSDGFNEVFIDGKCLFLGKMGQRAGLGVWWGEDHKLNSIKRVTGDKLTKNSTEVQAATEAIRLAGEAGQMKKSPKKS